jgi:hypothetical protein
VQRLQARYLRRQGASPQEIRRWLPALTAQIGAESNFTQGVGSSAGARDIAQFMPGTATSYGVRLGDNKIKDDIRGQIRYMLPLLRQHGLEDALRGYNAGPGAIDASRGFSETNSYVQKILGSKSDYRGLVRGAARPGAPEPRRGGPRAQIALPASGGPRQLSEGSQGVAALLAQLQGEKQPIQSAGLQGPAHSAGAAMPEGYQLPAAGGGPAPKRDLRGLLEAIGTPGGGIDRASSPGVQVPGVQGTPGQRNSGGQPARQRGSLAGGNRNTTAKGIGSKLEEFAQEQGWPIGSGKRNYVPPGGSSTSDHFWQDGEWARDFPLSNQGDIDKAGRKVARQLGIDGIDSSGFTERVVKLGRHRYKVQIITKPHGTGPHLHVGVQRV